MMSRLTSGTRAACSGCWIGLVLGSALLNVACGGEGMSNADQPKNGGSSDAVLMAAANDETLSDAVAQDLVLLREEEKLARDVYLSLAERYAVPIFNNIASSEQTHMDRVGELISFYGLQDPIRDDSVGVFDATVFQDLYDSLTRKGAASLAAALAVGVEVEELDIHDIQTMLDNEPPDAVTQVYDNLACGSRNHLRSFTAQLLSEGGSYTAEHLTQAEVDAILDGSQERCGR